jgi:hypothetical protein
VKVLKHFMFFVGMVHVGYQCSPQVRTHSTLSNPLVVARQGGIRTELLQGQRIYVLFDGRFSVMERKAMTDTFGRFNHDLGLVPRITETHSPFVFDLYVLRSSQGMRESDLGLYEHNTSFIRIDPLRSASYNQLSSVFMHEVGHWLGMMHVCNGREALPRYDCSPVGRGDSIMNPFINPFRSAVFSEYDRLEFYRIQGR